MTVDVWKEHLDRIFADPGFVSSRSMIVQNHADISSISETDAQEIFRFISQYRAQMSGKKVAILSRKEFDKTRMFEKLIASTRMADAIVFNDLVTACAWLGSTCRIRNGSL